MTGGIVFDYLLGQCDLSIQSGNLPDASQMEDMHAGIRRETKAFLCSVVLEELRHAGDGSR